MEMPLHNGTDGTKERIPIVLLSPEEPFDVDMPPGLDSSFGIEALFY